MPPVQYIKIFFPRIFSVLLSTHEERSLYCRIFGSKVSTFGGENFPIRVSYRFLASNKTRFSGWADSSTEWNSRADRCCPAFEIGISGGWWEVKVTSSFTIRIERDVNPVSWLTADCGVDSVRGEADAAEEREGGAVGVVEGE
ncbi:hypothetical protein LXL04_038674 [Taraxacum kok-saghyz]